MLADGEGKAKFYGSVWPRTAHQMRRPPNWSELSVEEQSSLTAAWENSPDAKIFNQEKCPIDFRIAADGTFTVPDLPAGDYGITIATWTGAPVTSRMVSRGHANISIPEMANGRSDEPLDIGVVNAYSVAPLRQGDPAPLFETSTFDGQPVKLADYRGKFILLNFWRTDLPESLREMADLKAAQTAWGQDKRFAVIGLNFDRKLLAAQKYAADNALAWAQCFLGEPSDIPARYRLRRPTTILVGPDGLILRPNLRGPEVAAALEDALGTK